MHSKRPSDPHTPRQRAYHPLDTPDLSTVAGWGARGDGGPLARAHAYKARDSWGPAQDWGGGASSLADADGSVGDGGLPFGGSDRAWSSRTPLSTFLSNGLANFRRHLALYISLPPRRHPGSPMPAPPSVPALPGREHVRFVALCMLWYTSSAMSSNTGKVILNSFRFPVTLTFVQFGFVALYCWIASHPAVGMTRLRAPTRQILWTTAPMAGFQIAGHIFSSLAISRVPVSTVHTIKALSPLFTVASYALLFNVRYSPATYLSLLPLTLGVMLATAFDMSATNTFGFLCALGSTLVFVSQNIFSKKLLPSDGAHAAPGPKLDKLNLLFYSSGMAFCAMLPLWLWSDGAALVQRWLDPHDHRAPTAHQGTHHVVLYLFLNGTVHFAQNLLAFAILASTSPVTYSIASLVKRIAVICIAIVWFSQPVHAAQCLGIALTGLGLYMYNSAKRDVALGEKRARQVEAIRDLRLPTTKSEGAFLAGRDTPPIPSSATSALPSAFAHMPPPPLPSLRPTTTVSGNGSCKPPHRPETSYPSPPPSDSSPPHTAVPLDAHAPEPEPIALPPAPAHAPPPTRNASVSGSAPGRPDNIRGRRQSVTVGSS